MTAITMEIIAAIIAQTNAVTAALIIRICADIAQKGKKKMQKTKRIKIYCDTWNTYGRQAQQDMAIEEMSELAKAILKYRRVLACCSDKTNMFDRASAYNNFVEELVDVDIMIEQLKLFCVFNKQQYKAIKKFKLSRLKKKVAEVDD